MLHIMGKMEFLLLAYLFTEPTMLTTNSFENSQTMHPNSFDVTVYKATRAWANYFWFKDAK